MLPWSRINDVTHAPAQLPAEKNKKNMTWQRHSKAHTCYQQSVYFKPHVTNGVVFSPQETFHPRIERLLLAGCYWQIITDSQIVTGFFLLLLLACFEAGTAFLSYRLMAPLPIVIRGTHKTKPSEKS